jgi:hypothetical protein
VKRIIQLFTIALFTLTFSVVSAGNYQIDDGALDQLFSSAQTISILDMGAETSSGFSDLSTPAFYQDKDPLVALLLNIFVGTLGVHRFYLGTEPLTGIAYILTLGGCGIVTFVDLIVLAINFDDISPYVDNPKFFMW